MLVELDVVARTELTLGHAVDDFPVHDLHLFEVKGNRFAQIFAAAGELGSWK